MAAVSYKGTLFKSHLSGDYNEPNIAAAACIALYFGLSSEDIKNALEAYIPNLNRSQEIDKNDQKILLDAYNANPTSMEAALRNFAGLDGSKAVILGDMFELGETSAQEHYQIAKLAIELKFDDIILIGQSFHDLKMINESLKSFLDKDEFLTYLRNNPIKKKRILIKGSRGMALEKLVENF